MKGAADKQFGYGVLSPDARHHFRSRLGVHDVGHFGNRLLILAIGDGPGMIWPLPKIASL